MQVKAIRLAEPVRRVQGHAANIRARCLKHKIRRLIQSESRTNQRNIAMFDDYLLTETSAFVILPDGEEK